MNIHLISYGQGLPVVFFHGWGFDHQIWLPLVEQLHENYQLFLVDLPGFGLTPLMDWNEFKRQLLEQLPSIFALAGWSLGGLYAQRLTIEEPHRVSSLINIASLPYFIAEDEWPAVPKNVFNQFYINLSFDHEHTLKSFISLQLNQKKPTISLGTIPSQASLNAGLQILEQWDFRSTLSKIYQPTCFMFGRLDPIAPVKIMEVMKNQYPHFNYVLFKHAAHMPFLSHTRLFIEEFHRFIK